MLNEYMMDGLEDGGVSRWTGDLVAGWMDGRLDRWVVDGAMCWMAKLYLSSRG